MILVFCLGTEKQWFLPSLYIGQPIWTNFKIVAFNIRLSKPLGITVECSGHWGMHTVPQFFKGCLVLPKVSSHSSICLKVFKSSLTPTRLNYISYLTDLQLWLFKKFFAISRWSRKKKLYLLMTQIAQFKKKKYISPAVF